MFRREIKWRAQVIMLRGELHVKSYLISSKLCTTWRPPDNLRYQASLRYVQKGDKAAGPSNNLRGELHMKYYLMSSELFATWNLPGNIRDQVSLPKSFSNCTS